MKKNIKKTVVITIIAILVIAAIVVVGLYIGDSSARNWIDRNILKKDIEQSNLPKIAIEESKNTKVIAYGSYVALLEENTLTIYNQTGKKVSDITVQVENPKFSTNGDYLLIGDEGNSDLYLIYGESLQWQKEVEGNVSQIYVNKNGAVGVVISGTVYKSIITMYDITGIESFKTYLSTTLATDVVLSEDGKYLSFIEINTSGAAISSKIKTVSVEKAKSNPAEAIIHTYDGNKDALFVKIKYKKEKLVGFSDDSVHVYTNGNDEKILEIDKNISFVDINNEGYVCHIKENSVENFIEFHLLNIETKKEIHYNLKNTAKNIYCNEGITGIDLGNEIHFVDTNGWLIKNYKPIKNIKDIVIGKKVVAILYKDSVEILGL